MCLNTTGIFTVHRYEIPFKKYGEAIKLVPFSDVHRYAPLHADKIWQKFIDRYKNDKLAYFIGVGDYLDELSASERKAYINADYHDSTTQNLSKFYVKRAKNLAKEISFMKGRLLGLCEGNHYYQLHSGETTTNVMCRELDAKYLGVKCFIEIILRIDKYHAHRIVLCCHHGEGGGRRASTSVSKLENMAHTHNADIILQGHDHRKNHIEQTTIGITNAQTGKPNVVERTKYCARTGGFLKGYIDQHQSYIVDANLPPNSLGNVEFHLIPKLRRRRIPVLNKQGNNSENKRAEKRWVNIEFHSCNYTEH